MYDGPLENLYQGELLESANFCRFCVFLIYGGTPFNDYLLSIEVQVPNGNISGTFPSQLLYILTPHSFCCSEQPWLLLVSISLGLQWPRPLSLIMTASPFKKRKTLGPMRRFSTAAIQTMMCLSRLSTITPIASSALVTFNLLALVVPSALPFTLPLVALYFKEAQEACSLLSLSGMSSGS
jgi:hypothetical protein